MSFADQMQAFCIKEAPEKTGEIVRKVILEIGDRLVTRSPVGDAKYWKYPAPPGYTGGRFRGNWQYGYGAAPQGQYDVIDKSGALSLGRIESGVASSQAAGFHWIANNLPYSERIEMGWSRQAPQGIIGLTELEFPQIVEMAKR